MQEDENGVPIPDGSVAPVAAAGTAPVVADPVLEGRWCPTVQLTPDEIGLTRVPTKNPADVSGHCFYLGKIGQSCTDTCWEQAIGRCDAKGTEFAAKSVEQCQRVLTEFGVVASAGSESQNDRAGCVWSDLGALSAATVMNKDNLYPLCSEQHNITLNHRVCACTAMFGKKEQFTEKAGACKNAQGAQSRYRTGTFRSKEECEDECARDRDCAAFASVHPWDGNARACHFYRGVQPSDYYTGDGSNRHIHCSVKEPYLATVGACKTAGGEMTLLKTSAYESLASCQAACTAHETCEAFQVAEGFQGGDNCILYGAGHTGNGVTGNRCYTKATGGIEA